MCGICGIIDREGRLPAAERERFVAEMNEALFHRGPDGSGSFSEAFYTLAMRRLAIIDLEQGDQPVFNERGDIGVFFNGEIYNYQELRRELLAGGHQFRTRSDTEVLVHLYEEEGAGMLERLKGMFALCLFDRQRKRFLLARDRFGEKPLYYHLAGGVLSFSSELASLLRNPGISRRLNQEALGYYLRTSLVPEPHTLFANIYSLPPGKFLLLEGNNLNQGSYFDLDYPVVSPIRSEGEAIASVRPLLERAVRRQTVSDVPIAAFLSGGIDSSTIVALLQEQSGTAISTFNVRFEDQAYDESRIARKVAEHCGTDHREVVVPNYQFKEDLFWMILQHVGFPFRDSSAIPTYLISREIGREVKVALSGDGGDELFGGYRLFQWYRQILALRRLPLPIRSGLNTGLQWAQRIPGLRDIAKVRQVQRAVNTSLQSRRDIPIALNEMFRQPEIDRLLCVKPVANGYPLLKDYPGESPRWSSLREIMYYRMRHTLPVNMLVKVDRMSMANSLEVRAPFLDPDLFEAAARLPDDLLIRRGVGKYLLRKIMKDKLPAEVFDHPKTGFNIPLHKYQNEAFRALAKDLLFTPSPLHEILDLNRLKMIFHLGLDGPANRGQKSIFQASHQLWMMMQLLGWMRRFRVELS